MYKPEDITVLVCVHSTSEINDKLLLLALESLNRQDIEGFKTLVVLDNCWEHTYPLIRHWWDEEFMIVENPNPKMGLAYVKNYGLSLINTKLVAFLDADDEYIPSKLETQLQYINKHPKVDFLGTHSMCRSMHRIDIKESANTPSTFDSESYLTHAKIKKRMPDENVMTHGSMLIKMKALQKLEGYRHVKGMEDWDLWKRAIESGYRFAQINERLYIYTIDSSVARE
jgi:glycosyltransferase involved in cell wall biosynthesis